jgi:hypothetical protein
VADLRLSQEAKRVCFRAQVVAITSGRTEVTTRDIAAAALRTDEVRARCDGAGLSVDRLTKALDPDDTFPRILGEVEESLIARGDSFGSRSHIHSLRPLPATPAMRSAFETMGASRGSTPVDLLHAILRSDPQLGNELTRLGLTADILQRP